MADLQVGVVGADLIVTLRDQSGALVDLSTSTSRYIYLTKPQSRGTTRYSATLVNGGTAGQMKYTTTTSADLSVPGDWTIQARYVNPLGDYPSGRGMFVVLPNSY